jgi:hypothetical protein
MVVFLYLTQGKIPFQSKKYCAQGYLYSSFTKRIVKKPGTSAVTKAMKT